MRKGKDAKQLDCSTEEKIKEAARKVFHEKGYAATRTRDIADAAGINLALLNYYFRSKEKLFDIIMLETVAGFIQAMATVLNNEQSILEEKVALIASGYIDFIVKEPNVPIFMLSEMRHNADELLKKVPIEKIVMNSTFFRQHREAVLKGKIGEPNPLQFLINLLSLIIFPFIAKPLLQRVGGVNDIQFDKMMQQRKKLIPVWIAKMMKAK